MEDLSHRSDDSGEYMLHTPSSKHGHEVDAQKRAHRSSNVYGLVQNHQEPEEVDGSEHYLDNADNSIALTITIEDAIGESTCNVVSHRRRTRTSNSSI